MNNHDRAIVHARRLVAHLEVCALGMQRVPMLPAADLERWDIARADIMNAAHHLRMIPGVDTVSE
jgi:hypothetical protein